MDLDQYLDLNHVVKGMQKRLDRSIKEWRTGEIKSEEPVMSCLIRNFSHHEWHSDVGRTSPVAATSNLYGLHRQGQLQTDEHGSDIAVTAIAQAIKAMRTILLQTKVGKNGKVVLERKQLKQACDDPESASRAFVVAINKETGKLLVHPSQPLFAQFNDHQETKVFDTSQWEPIDAFVSRWLKGQAGVASDYDNPVFEATLKSHAIVPEGAKIPLRWVSAAIREVAEDDLPDWWLVEEFISR